MADATTAFFNGEFCPVADANINIRSKALNYGLGCFEGIRAYWTAEANQLFVFRVRDHFERLNQSCRILRLPLAYGVDKLVDLTLELLRRNEHREDVYIRPLVYSGSEKLAPILSDEPCAFAMYTLPLQQYLDTTKGITACVSSWRRVGDNVIPARAKPTAAYMNSALARYEARTNGFDEAIFLTHDGFVSEGSAEHIFLVRGGKLVTPTNQEDNLDGVTRRTIADIAPELGLSVVERRISRTELYVAEEAFLCGTGAEIVPLVSIDRRPIGSGKVGPITQRVQALYFKVVHAQAPKFADWCMPVYS